MNPIIKIENLSKMYRLGVIGTGTISHDLNRWWHKVQGKEDPYLKIGEANVSGSKSDSGYVWALKDINLEVMPGEVLGIIGKNGAGKSTLLKILSKVTGPTTGKITYRGRIGSLLEVGTGFHGELTGKENIFLNGAILGMTKAEIRGKLDEIVDFAGVERYIDTPVKRYSSGMKVRLGFAVAAHLEPEILVVDEVLAVGDAEFQKKAVGKMQDISYNDGRTILFVSHNMGAINTLCNKAVLLKNGTIENIGSTDEIIEKYLMVNSSIENNILNTNKRVGNGYCKLLNISVFSLRKKNKIAPTVGEPLILEFEFDKLINYASKDYRFDFHIQNGFGQKLAWLSTTFKENRKENTNVLSFQIPINPLPSGNYFITTYLNIRSDVTDWITEAYSFQVNEGKFYETGKLPPPDQNTNYLVQFDLK